MGASRGLDGLNGWHIILGAEEMESFGLEFDIVSTAHVNRCDRVGGLNPIFHREASADLCKSGEKVSAYLGHVRGNGGKALEIAADQKLFDLRVDIGSYRGRVPQGKCILLPDCGVSKRSGSRIGMPKGHEASAVITCGMPIVLCRQKKELRLHPAALEGILNGEAGGILKELVAEAAPEIDVESLGHFWLMA